MKQSVYLFPFIEILEPLDFFNVKLEPGTSENLDKLDNEHKKIIETFLTELKGHKILLDKFIFSISSLSIDDFKKLADCIRYRLSYDESGLEYNHALFLSIQPKEGSLMLSVNGGCDTLLDSANFVSNFPRLERKILKGSLSDIVDNRNSGEQLLKMLGEKSTTFFEKANVCRALDWYSKSFRRGYGHDERDEIVCMAIAFEALIGSPKEDITSTFKSYISTFFNDNNHLNNWAKQFYEIRSEIVHGKQEKSTYFSLKETRVEFIKHADLARVVFRDLIEKLAQIGKMKSKYDYEDLFFIDKNRIEWLRKELSNLSSGFNTEDDICAVGAAKQELRGDKTLEAKQILDINAEFARALAATFSVTPFATDFNALYDGLKNIKPNQISKLQQSADDTILKLKDILAQKEAFPYREGNEIFPAGKVLSLSDLLSNVQHSNLFEDVIELTLEWFRFAKEALYEINE